MGFVRLGILAAALLINPALGAQISSVKTACGDQKAYCRSVIDFAGDIVAGDETVLDAVIAKAPVGREVEVRLSSNGGSVRAALALGRILRSHEASVSIPAGAKCLSSCVFLLVGGVQRGIDGVVGIHRPYFTNLSPGAAPTVVDASYKALARDVREYLDEMNMPPSLAEAMFLVRPDEMRQLSKADLDQFGLSDPDPAFEERLIAQFAAKYGLTSVQYRSRSAVAVGRCAPKDRSVQEFERADRCFGAMIVGVPVEEFARRRAIFDRTVASLPAERQPECFKSIVVKGGAACP